VVDLDLEKFFDRVNHDKLMARIAKRVSDKRMLRLIRAFLEAGVMEGGLVSPVDEGTPQGGPVTPLIQKVMSNFWRVVKGWRASHPVLDLRLKTTDGSINESGQGEATECRIRHAPAQCWLTRSPAAFIARVRSVRTSGISVPGGSDRSGRAGRSLRVHDADYDQAPGGNGTSSAGLREKQWADHRSDRDPRVGRVSRWDSEEAWVSRAHRTARFKFTLTMHLIACTIRSLPRPTVFWCPFGSVPSVAL
jgi:hypothetical protein